MEISWLGHSCFILKGKEKVIVTDPCHPSLGYHLDKPRADIVTISHFHPGHCYIEGIANNPREIKGPGEYEIGGTLITGIAAFHDNQKGKIRGKNTIYVIEMDGITLCHLGDLGHLLTPQSVEELEATDILFLPVGETSTMPVDMAVETVKQLSPSIVIPMHYKTEALTPRDIQPLDKFLEKIGLREAEPKAKLSVTQSSLSSSTQTVVLDYKRNAFDKDYVSSRNGP